MTREEAIDRLRSIKTKESLYDDVAALRMAISALEAEPSDDAISRQAVSDMAGKSEWFDSSDDYNDFVYKLYALPSVHAVPRTGHWIFEEGDGKTCADGYVCSACNKSFHTHVPYFAEYKYCPNCGAKMESEEAEND